MSVYAEILEGYRSEHRLRSLPAQRPVGFLDFSSNDYMGLAADPAFARHFVEMHRDWRFTSSASRLLAGDQTAYTALEQWLAQAYSKDVMLFNSGYHANVGCVSALSVPGTAIVADKLVHASIIDGIRLGGAVLRRFRHNDVASLRRELAKASAEADRVLVIVESVYSMDGDEAPLKEIVALKDEYPGMILYVDEAHALGVRGQRGLGVCEEQGVLEQVDLLVGTFGKACASVGAFVAASEEMKQYILNSARSFIFSTALPPLNVEYTLYVMKSLQGMALERRHLADISARFRSGLEHLTGEASVSTSQIVPLMVGNSEKALKISAQLYERNILALPIRRPTVPPGTERLRFSLSAAMTEADIDLTLCELGKIYEA